MSQTVAGRTVTASLLAALTMAGVIISSYLPLAGTFLLAFAGIPGLLVVLAWGISWFFLYGLFTLGLAFMWGGALSSVLLIPLVLFPAASLAWAIVKGFPAMQAVGLSLVAACLFSTMMWLISPLFGSFGTQLWSTGFQLKEQGKSVMAQMKSLTPKKDVDEVKMELFYEHFRAWIDFMVLLVPVTFIFIWHLISLGTLFLSANMIAPKFGYTLPPLPPFSTWKFDWNLIWMMFLGWFFFYGAPFFEPLGLEYAVKLVGANCLAISKILFFIIGLSIMVYYFEKNRISPPFRIGLSFLAILFNQLLVWLGIVNIWFDFRAPKDPRKSEENSDDDSFF